MRFLSLLLFLPLILAGAAPAPTVTLPRCTQAQHASYTTIGPDGSSYATWHPTIDPYYGCYNDHEHGSNPAMFLAGVSWQAGSGVWPTFGYSAQQHGMTEGHAGFKVYVFRHAGRRFLLLHHFGTANAANAACNDHHTLDIAEWDEQSSAIIRADYGMANFGQAVENTSGIPIAAACNTGSGTGVRQLPVGPQSVGYEPWRADRNANGLDARLTFNTLNPQTTCADLACASTIPRSDVGGLARGTYRTLTIEWWNESGFAMGSFVCVPYGMDYHYDCSEQAADEEFYRRMPFVTGAN